MKFPALIVLLTVVCLASSCTKRASHEASGVAASKEPPAKGYCLPASSAWPEEEYTQWMTSAELQFYQDQAAPGQYFAHVEGRNNAGLSEYRAVRPQPLPVEQYVEAGIFWGQNDKRLFDTELRLLRAGFIRKSMQVFIDASGCALHQFVWLRPAGTKASTAASTPAPPTQKRVTQPDPATQPAVTNPPEPLPNEETAATEPTISPAPAAGTDLASAADESPAEEKLPTAMVVPPSELRPTTEPEAPNPKKFTTYTVVHGDVLERIARRHHCTAEAILTANDLKNDSLHIGQKLKIPKK